jgi:heme A synthase
LRAIRWTATAAVVLTYGLIVLGAVVRATNSGLSCPDWPTCYGHWLPLPGQIPHDAGYAYHQVMFEWVHRLIAGTLLGPLILAIAVLTWLQRRRDRGLAVMGGAVLLLLLSQASLGAVTVLDQNSPWSVALHLGNALLVMAVLLLIAVRAGRPAAVAAAPRSAFVLLVAAAWLATFLAMLSAAITAKSGASLACSTWPLCDGALVPNLADPLIAIHFTHRVLAGLTGLLLLGQGLLALRAEGAIRRLGLLALLLVLCQIGLGAAVILLLVAVPVAVLHQAMGVLIFVVVTLLLWRSLGVGAVQPRSGRRDPASATSFGISHEPGLRST